MTDILIRPADYQDVDRLYEIECACFSVPWSKASLMSFLADKEHTFCITACTVREPQEETAYTADEAENAAANDATVEAEIMGYAGVLYVLDEGEITNIAVHPLFTGKGVGFALMSAAQEYCRRAGVKSLHLEVRASNERAIALYRKCGFVRTGIRRGYYGDNGEDALLYSWKDV